MKLFILFLLVSHFAFADPIHEQVVILGSGPAGLTAAIYTARAGLSTLVMEGQEPGGQISLSDKIENYPGYIEGINGFELGTNMREQAIRFGAVIRGGKVLEADLSQRPFRLVDEGGKVIFADALIIATGASAKWLGLDSERVFIGNGVSSCAVCDGFLHQDQEVLVVGGGDTALEDALFLSTYASKVTVVHRRNALKASKYLQNKALANPKIHFIWDSVVEEIADLTLGQVTHAVLKNRITGERQNVTCQGIFVAIGHLPETNLFRGQLELNDAGYILTKPFSTCTNVDGVFAAGDVADFRYRQAATAVGTGCMAGIDAYHFLQE